MSFEAAGRVRCFFLNVLDQCPSLMIHAAISIVQESDKLFVRLRNPARGNGLELRPNHPDSFLDVLDDLQRSFFGDYVCHEPVSRSSQQEKRVVEISGRGLAESVEKDRFISSLGYRRMQ